MKWLLSVSAMSLGGWVGWWVGALFSTFTAFIVSIVASGVALYYVNRFLAQYMS